MLVLFLSYTIFKSATIQMPLFNVVVLPPSCLHCVFTGETAAIHSPVLPWRSSSLGSISTLPTHLGAFQAPIIPQENGAFRATR